MENWINNDFNCLPIYKSDVLQHARLKVFLKFKTFLNTLDIADDLTLWEDVVTVLSVNCKLSEAKFGIHSVKRDGSKVPDMSTFGPEMFIKNLLESVFSDTNLTLATKIATDKCPQFIVYDFDIYAKLKDVSFNEANISLECKQMIDNLVESERCLLNALITSIESFGNPALEKPLVCATPRGLHIVFFQKDYKGRFSKVTRNRGPHALNMGVSSEVVCHNFCGLISRSYKFLCYPMGSEKLAAVPLPFFPAQLEEALTFDIPIPEGKRYNTVLSLINSRQLNFQKGYGCRWYVQHMLVGELHKDEAEFLFKLAEKKESRRSTETILVRKQTGLKIVEDINKKLQMGDDPGKYKSHKATLEALKQFFQTNQGSLLCNTYPINTMGYLYCIVFKEVFGLGLLFAHLLCGVNTYLIFVDKIGWNFFSSDEMVWVVIDENKVLHFISSIVGRLAFFSKEPKVNFIKEVLEEFKQRVTHTDWPHHCIGYVFKDNRALLLGHLQPITPYPRLFLRHKINSPIDSCYSLGSSLWDYLTNTCGLSPGGINLLRTFLFSAFFSIVPVTHYLVLKGNPGSGKTLMQDLIQAAFGKETIHIIPRDVSANFAFSGASVLSRFFIAPDVDMSDKVDVLLSFVKTLSTSGEVRAQRKYENDLHTIRCVFIILIMNQYLDNKQPEAFVRRQIVINPKPVSPNDRDQDLKSKLMDSIGSFGVWVSATPHVLCRLLDYSIVLNYSCNDWQWDSVSHFFSEIKTKLKIFADDQSQYFIPMRTLSGNTTGRDSVVGLYDYYLEWAEARGNRQTYVNENSFKGVLSEILKPVFRVPFNPQTGDHYIQITGYHLDSRSPWEAEFIYCLGLCYDASDSLKVQIPCKAVALATYHIGAMLLNPFYSNEDQLRYTPLLPIYHKLPAPLLRAFVSLVNEGIPYKVSNSFFQSYKKTCETLTQINSLNAQFKDVLLNDDYFEEAFGEFQKAQIYNEADESGDVLKNEPVELVYQDLGEDKPIDSRRLKPEEILDFSKPEAITSASRQSSQTPMGLYQGLRDLAREDIKSNENKENSPPSYKTSTETSTETSAQYTEKYYSRSLFLCIKEILLRYSSDSDLPLYALKQGSKIDEVLELNKSLPGYEFEFTTEKDYYSSVELKYVQGSFERFSELIKRNSFYITEKSFTSSQSSLYAVFKNLERKYSDSEQDIRYLKKAFPRCFQTSNKTNVLKKAVFVESVTQPIVKRSTGSITRPNLSLMTQGIGRLKKSIKSTEPESSGSTPVFDNVKINTLANFIQNIISLNKFSEDEFDKELLPTKFNDSLKELILYSCNQPVVLKGADILCQAVITCFNYELLNSRVKRKAKDKKQESKLEEIKCMIYDILESDKNKLNDGDISSPEHIIKIIKDYFNELDRGSVLTVLLTPSIKNLSALELLTIIKAFVNNNFRILPHEKSSQAGFEWFNIVLEALKEEPFVKDAQHFDVGKLTELFLIEKVWLTNLKETLQIGTEWPNGALKPYFLKGFQGADYNERKRLFMARNLSGNPFAKNVNEQSQKLISISYAIYGICCSIQYWFFNNVQFSKSYTRNQKNWAQNKQLTLFATTYTVNNVKDPGRLAIQGVSYTTTPRIIRDRVVPLILKGFKPSIKAFIIDIGGCHGRFQAAIDPEAAPYIYNIYKNSESVWKDVLEDPKNSLNMQQKNLLKVVFYAACNGGTIEGEQNLKRHLKNFNSSEVQIFTQAFITTEFYKDLLAIARFWNQFTDGIYVPTSVNKVHRDSPHKLSSPVYCALEFLFITEIQSLVFKFYKNNNITILQGIHDGTLFILEAETLNTKELEEYIREYLYPLSKKVLKGIKMDVEIKEL